MQLDRNALNQLLSLNDKQLETLIKTLTRQHGLDLSQFHVKPGDMESLRKAMQNATDEELLAISRRLGGGK